MFYLLLEPILFIRTHKYRDLKKEENRKKERKQQLRK